MAVFLVLSILFNTLYASCYKLAVRKGCNLQAVNVWLYIGATATMLAYVALRWRLPFHPNALLLGVAAGVMVFFATLSFFHHIRHGQLSASWTVITLSIAFPVLASMFIWHERPSARQVVAMALVVIALVLLGKPETDNQGRIE